MIEVLNEITEIILWYKELPSDYLELNELIYQRKQIVTLQVQLATEVSYCREQWKNEMYNYEKIKITKRYKSLDSGVSKADTISRVNSLDEYRKMLKSESLYRKLEDRYKSHIEVISSMNQHIAQLRNEFESVKKKYLS